MSSADLKEKLLVFLSHANEDKLAVRKLCNRLRDDGFDPWFDEERLLPGQDWHLEIEQALRKSDAILLCFSERSVSKEGYIQREYKKAMDYQKEKPEGTIFVIPVRLDKREIPFFLRELQCVDYPSGYEKLKISLNVRAENALSPANFIKPPTIHPNTIKVEGGKPDFKQVQLVLEGDFKEFNETRQEDLRLVLASLLRVESEDIRILQVYSGSIVVILEMPEIAIDRLRELAVNADNRLKAKGVVSIQVIGEQIIAIPTDEQISLTSSYNSLGISFAQMGNYKAALEYLEKALTIEKQSANREAEGITLSNIASVYKAQGNYETALRNLEQALAIQHQIGDKAKEGLTLNNISGIYWRQGDYEAALNKLEQALAIQQQIGDQMGEGTTLNNIATIHQARGDYETALSKYKQALDIRQQIGDKAGEEQSLNNIGTIYQAQNNHNMALEYLQKALRICQQIGNKESESLTLNSIGVTYQLLNEHKTALEYLYNSLAIIQQLGDQGREADTLSNIAMSYHEQGYNNEAEEYFNQALMIHQRLGDQSAEAFSLNDLANFFADEGNYEAALLNLQKAVTIQQGIGDNLGLALSLSNMGLFYAKYADGISKYEVSAFLSLGKVEQDISKLIDQKDFATANRLLQAIESIGSEGKQIAQKLKGKFGV